MTMMVMVMVMMTAVVLWSAVSSFVWEAAFATDELMQTADRQLAGVVVNDTQSDSIQYLNFAKKWFIQYSIQYCFTQDSIQNIIQFKINSGDSIQNIIQFNSQGMINTGRIGKVPKNWPKSVQNRQKRGLIIKNGKYRFKNWVIHSFHDKIQFKGLFNIIFSGIFNSKNYSIIFFPRKFN